MIMYINNSSDYCKQKFMYIHNMVEKFRDVLGYVQKSFFSTSIEYIIDNGEYKLIYFDEVK